MYKAPVFKFHVEASEHPRWPIAKSILDHGRATFPWSGRSNNFFVARSCYNWWRKEHATFARRGPLDSVEITGLSLLGTENEIFKRQQADLVQVHREWVWYLMRLGCSLPLVEPERKSLVTAGDGFSRVANLTDAQSSDLAMDDTIGSEDDSILMPWTMVWMSTSTIGCWNASSPTLWDANIIWEVARCDNLAETTSLVQCSYCV